MGLVPYLNILESLMFDKVKSFGKKVLGAPISGKAKAVVVGAGASVVGATQAMAITLDTTKIESDIAAVGLSGSTIALAIAAVVIIVVVIRKLFG